MKIRFPRNIGRTWFCLAPRNVWVGRGRYCVGIRDHRHIRPFFTERYRRRPHSHYWHVGPWCFSLDTDWMSRRPTTTKETTDA